MKKLIAVAVLALVAGCSSAIFSGPSSREIEIAYYVLIPCLDEYDQQGIWDVPAALSDLDAAGLAALVKEYGPHYRRAESEFEFMVSYLSNLGLQAFDMADVGDVFNEISYRRMQYQKIVNNCSGD